MKHQYDLVFGLGVACSCSQSLRRANLQLLSFPGDWTSPLYKLPKTETNLPTRVDWLCRGFEGFFDPGDFVFVCKNEWNGKDNYGNAKTHYIFNHDFPAGCDIYAEMPKVVAKYEKRRNRLVELIGQSHRILAVRLDFPNGDFPSSVDDARYALKRLNETFPGHEFDFLLIQCDPATPFAARAVETIEPHLFRLAFDYRKTKPDKGDSPQIPDLNLTSAAVEAFAAVRDYRTKAERAAFKRQKLLKHWAKYGATSRGEYLVNRLRALLGGRKS